MNSLGLSWIDNINATSVHCLRLSYVCYAYLEANTWNKLTESFVIYSKLLINAKLKVSFILHTFAIYIVGFLFLGLVSGVSFYQDLRWWSKSKTSDSPHCFLVESKDGRLFWWQRGISVCPLSCVTSINPPRTLVTRMLSSWLGTVSKKIHPTLHSNRPYLPLSLVFPSHTLLVKRSYSCSQALSLQQCNEQLVCG